MRWPGGAATPAERAHFIGARIASARIRIGT